MSAIQNTPRGEPRPRALLVGDDLSRSDGLAVLLRGCGYDAVPCGGGAVALRALDEHAPEVIFIDLAPSGQHGLELAPRMKDRCGDRFVPVIFIADPGGGEDITRCVDAGGDDLVTRPLDQATLAAKLRAMERIRELHRRTGALHARSQDELGLARRVLEGAVLGANVLPPGVAVHLAPAATFNGDILLSARAPDGDLYVMLGDFTGHGLQATIGALPTAEIFRAMTAKGFAPAAILAEISRKLRTMLPTGMFLAAAFLRVDRGARSLSVINCGMPDVLVAGERAVAAALESRALPLAVTDDEDFAAAEVRLEPPARGRVLLVSDGALEVTNVRGEMFGGDRLRRLLCAHDGQSSVIPQITAAIEAFRGEVPAADDIGLVEVLLSERLFDPSAAPAAPRGDPAAWRG